MRFLVPALLAGAALAGCIQSEPVGPASLPAALEGLVVPAGSTSVELRGRVELPGQGMDMLPGQVDEQALEVPAGAILVRLNLTWAAKGPTRETSDLDMFVVDSEGREAGRAASLDDPEVASIRITPKVHVGTWTVRVVNFNNPATDYTVLAEVFQ